jgi:hypothetical protein
MPAYSRQRQRCCCDRSRPGAFSFQAFVTPGRSISEESEQRQANPFELPLHRRRRKREKAPQGEEKAAARRD